MIIWPGLLCRQDRVSKEISRGYYTRRVLSHSSRFTTGAANGGTGPQTWRRPYFRDICSAVWIQARECRFLRRLESWEYWAWEECLFPFRTRRSKLFGE